MKQDIRRVHLAQRKELTPEMRARLDAAISARLLAWLERQSVRCLGVYWPIRGEPDLRHAYDAIARQGVQLALPVVVGTDLPLHFAAWSPGEPTETGPMNVSVPVPPHRIVSPDALLIPCVGFNRERIRLGYGGGFYDRTLARAPRPLAIGIAYQQALAEFAAEPHDVALDIVITEEAGLV
jgi:5-formyltetrahydrofolate cyclo-ligase